MFTKKSYGLGAILYDLNGTNLDWRCIQQNYRGVVFCAEIKVLQTPQNLLRIFMDQKTTNGPEQHLGGCPEGGTTHQDAPGPPGAPWWVVPSSWLFWPSHEASRVSFVPKKRQKVSAHLENFHFCTKNNTTVVLLKTASVRVSSMQSY